MKAKFCRADDLKLVRILGHVAFPNQFLRLSVLGVFPILRLFLPRSMPKVLKDGTRELAQISPLEDHGDKYTFSKDQGIFNLFLFFVGFYSEWVTQPIWSDIQDAFYRIHSSMAGNVLWQDVENKSLNFFSMVFYWSADLFLGLLCNQGVWIEPWD